MADQASWHLGADLFEGLTSIGEDGRAVPGVAYAWETSSDGKTWTFHLRPEARWSNGEPLTANDFIYAWQRELNPKTGAQYANSLLPLKNAQEIITGKLDPTQLGVVAPDPHTLVIQLQTPTPYLPDLLDGTFAYPLPRSAIEQYGEKWTRPGNLVSDGPFSLCDWKFGGSIVLSKNPFYWDANRVHLSKVIYLPLSDMALEALRYRVGDLDITDSFPASQFPYFKEEFGKEVHTSPDFATYGIAFNLSFSPFKDNEYLRKALSVAIDREDLVKYLKGDLYTPAYSLVPPHPRYRASIPDWAKLSKPERHALALDLFHKAGFSASHPPTGIVLTSPAQGTDDRHYMEAIVTMWRTVLGIDASLSQPEFKVMLQERELNKLSLFQYAWSGDYLDPFNFLQLFESKSALNNSDYSNRTYDNLLESAQSEQNETRRYNELSQAEGILNSEVPFIPLFYYSTRHLIKSYVGGWNLNPTDLMPSKRIYILEHQ